MQWKQLLLKFHYYATSWIIHWEDELWRIIKILPGSFSVCYTRCFPVCCKWVDLGLCHLFLFSRLSFTFLSLYLFFFHIFMCFTPCILCPTNFVPSFCWKHTTEDFFQATLLFFSMPDTPKFPLSPYPAQSKIISLVLLIGENYLTCNLIVCVIGIAPLVYKAQMIHNSCELLKLVVCLSRQIKHLSIFW